MKFVPLLKMHNLLQISLLRNGMQHMAAGVLSAVVLKKQYHNYVVRPGGVHPDEPIVSRNYEFGIVGGIGREVGRITADIRYERSTGLSRLATLYANGKRLHLLIKYRLK